MTSRNKSSSKILDAVLETARNIHELRNRNKLSQTVFAAVLNTSPSTIRQWEIGARHPSGPSLKLLNLLDKKGLDALI